MSARKAYISSLGTTGLLVAAALAMLIVVGALVAFDRWPTQAVAEAESVQIADDGPEAIRRAAAPSTLVASGAQAAPAALGESARPSSDLLRGAATRAGRVERSGGSAERSPAARVDDPVVSDLPAPDSTADVPAAQSPAPEEASPQGTGSPGGSASPVLTLPPTPIAPSGGDGLAEVTTQLGDGVGYLSPHLGQTVRGTGATVNGALNQILGTRGAN
jgi:hypothetical protein